MVQLRWSALSVSGGLLPAGGGLSGDRNFDRKIFPVFFSPVVSAQQSGKLFLIAFLWSVLVAGSLALFLWVFCTGILGLLFFRATLQSLCSCNHYVCLDED